MIEMQGVREHEYGSPVELDRRDGRLVIRAWGEPGDLQVAKLEIDLLDLQRWLRDNPTLWLERVGGDTYNANLSIAFKAIPVIN